MPRQQGSGAHFVSFILCCCFIEKLCLTACDTMDCSTPLSMGFPSQKYWSLLPFPSAGDLSDPGIKPASPALAGGLFITETLGKPKVSIRLMLPPFYR